MYRRSTGQQMNLVTGDWSVGISVLSRVSGNPDAGRMQLASMELKT